MNRSDRDYLEREIAFWGFIILSYLTSGWLSFFFLAFALYYLIRNWNK